MKHLIVLSSLLIALQASADCPPALPTELPVLPDGPIATETAMRDARLETQAYVATIEAYLRCRNMLLTDGSYNELVDRATAAADGYNRQLQRYRQRNGALAKN